jgi:heme exporter protein D
MMDDLLTYLNMGGYAAWVWSAYGATVVSLVAILVFTLRTLKAREREFETLRTQRRGDIGSGVGQ